MINQDLLIEFYKNKNYTLLKSILHDTKSKDEMRLLARVHLEEKDYKKASLIYSKLGMLYEFGRCELLQGNISNTQDIWNNIKVDSPASLWGRSLLEFINLYVVHVPTFFQIRAFLEVDLDAMLNANLITYCENLVNGAHLLATSNQESYKFIGRVFVNNNHFDLAHIYLQRAKELCYIDPEVHYLLAMCYLNSKDIDMAKKSLNTSLEKGFGYYPAKRMLAELDNNKNSFDCDI
jgi:tetratricopeptide (TPR) repeat protein